MRLDFRFSFDLSAWPNRDMTGVHHRVVPKQPLPPHLSPIRKQVSRNLAIQLCLTEPECHCSIHSCLRIQIHIASPTHHVSPHRIIELKGLNACAHISINQSIHAQFLSERKHVPFHVPIHSHTVRPHD